nr:FHA domain-containing protein [Herbiconiux sp. VKM Ac-1786]
MCGECGTSAIAPRPTLGDTARHDRRALLEALAAEAAARAATPPPAPERPAREQPASRATPQPQQQPAPRATPEPPAPTPFTLVFSTGESIHVHGPGLVGRNPQPADGEHVDYRVQLIDPQRSVSKTHLAFDVTGDTLVITDRRSSNGTRVVTPPDPEAAPGDPAGRARSAELEPGVPTPVPRGSRVGIGDEWFDVR